MKNTILTTTLLLLTLFSCKKQDCPDCETCTVCETCPPESCKSELTKGLLAYYPFNGNANDASGNGNNGTFVNGAGLTTDHLGRTDKAAAFDGINDYIIVNDNGRINVDTLTISLLLYTNDADKTYGVISKQDYNTAKGYAWAITQAEVNTRNLSFAVAPPNDDCNVVQLYNQGIAVYSTKAVNTNIWHHIMVTFAGNEQKFYIDGVLTGSKTRDIRATKKCTNNQLIIGNWWKDAPLPFNGKLDEIRIYKRLLNECELAELNRPFN